MPGPRYPFRPERRVDQVTAIQDIDAAHTMPSQPANGPPVPVAVSEESAGSYGSRLITLLPGIETRIATFIENRKDIKIVNTGAAVMYHNGQPGVSINNDEIPPLYGFIILKNKSEVYALSVLGTTVKILEEYY